ncbi:MAG: heat-inducible transcription repressor HrcA [Thermoleophilaceae bacterium]|nr:heat-inducible transcription repressor HrcA [Thermoleophilaceae bacterium]
MLSPRQEQVLRIVVEGYIESGDPVGSQLIAARDDVDFSASTIRYEFAVLEARGLLAQPHTSAGRVPTEGGVRYFVDELLSAVSTATTTQPQFELTNVKSEVEEVMREATEALADATDLLALISAPSVATEAIVRVELVLLQQRKLMAVVITSVGNVSRRVFEFATPLDSGLVTWANGYLNETLQGTPVGARMIRTRLSQDELGPAEREFINALSVVFVEPPRGGDTLFIGGASHLVTADRYSSMPGLDRLMNALEERAAVLTMVRSSINERGVFLRIGQENELPELAGASVVAANYGTPGRNLGSVSVIGPVRMDYAHAIGSVRCAAAVLSEFVADVYV